MKMLPRIWRWLLEERMLLLLAVISTTVVFGAIYIVLDRGLRRWTDRDLGRKAALVWSALALDVRQDTPEELEEKFEALAGADRLIGVLACWGDGRTVSNAQLPPQMSCSSPLARAAVAAEGNAIIARLGGRDVHTTAHRIEGSSAGQWVVIVQDRSFVSSRRGRVVRVIVIAAYLSLLALILLGKLGIRVGRARFDQAARDLLSHIREGQIPAELPSDLQPLATDVTDTLARFRARTAIDGDSTGPARLRRLVATELAGNPLVVVANREPYLHEFGANGEVRVVQPASGLVSGVEPVLRACGGTWIGHGGGSADRETADASGRLAVPPDHPEYVLRRVFLSDEEYDGYYFGFSNEGLWPLCHIAHTRPVFRPGDWDSYQSANRRFAQATVEEGGSQAFVLVQDYHYAVLPRYVRELAPEAVVSLFWHIPWPNSEVIGICPWKEALLDGMLGADVLGFHTRYHCLNFLETARRYLECRVDLDAMAVEYNRHRTLVRPYPISIEWPYPAAPRHAGTALRASLGIDPERHVAVGVDRSDYTKGLVERVEAVERMLELYPDAVGRFIYVQLAAPSRTRIKRYRDVISDLEETVLRVNRRFGGPGYKPVVLQLRSFSPDEVRAYYAMADSAIVTPLHDGMNLVAKEYVASCSDGDGALVLSTFAGAAKELEGALIVNPYDPDSMARAIYSAMEMPRTERRERMEMMRSQIAKNSIYDWSRKLLHDMAEVSKRRDRLWTEHVDEAEKIRLEAAARW
jgi:trehalose-6-phosphate synthase